MQCRSIVEPSGLPWMTQLVVRVDVGQLLSTEGAWWQLERCDLDLDRMNLGKLPFLRLVRCEYFYKRNTTGRCYYWFQHFRGHRNMNAGVRVGRVICWTSCDGKMTNIYWDGNMEGLIGSFKRPTNGIRSLVNDSRYAQSGKYHGKDRWTFYFIVCCVVLDTTGVRPARLCAYVFLFYGQFTWPQFGTSYGAELCLESSVEGNMWRTWTSTWQAPVQLHDLSQAGVAIGHTHIDRWGDSLRANTGWLLNVIAFRSPRNAGWRLSATLRLTTRIDNGPVYLLEWSKRTTKQLGCPWSDRPSGLENTPTYRHYERTCKAAILSLWWPKDCTIRNDSTSDTHDLSAGSTKWCCHMAHGPNVSGSSPAHRSLQLNLDRFTPIHVHHVPCLSAGPTCRRFVDLGGKAYHWRCCRDARCLKRKRVYHPLHPKGKLAFPHVDASG